MKYLLLFLTTLLLSCQSGSKQGDVGNGTIDSSEILTKYDVKESHMMKTTAKEGNTIASTTESRTSQFLPDTTINEKLFLHYAKTLSDFYTGSKQLTITESLREHPVVVFTNISSSEYLIASQYEGGTRNAFSCFEIGYLEDDRDVRLATKYQSDIAVLRTESGICLGLSMKDIIRIKGNEFEKTQTGDFTILRYRIDNYKSSPFLLRYNMPGYFMEIYLRNDSVKKVLFGFDYP